MQPVTLTPEQLDALSPESLKALAYDQIAILDNADRNLKILNAKIAEKSKPLPETPKEETPV